MRARATALRLVGAATVLAAVRVLAQEPAPAEDLFLAVTEQIEAIQSLQGSTSPELIGPLTNLGLISREQGDTVLAIAAFERAKHVVRVNHGLFSFKEAPLLRQLVQIEEARGNAAAAWDLEHELIDVIHRSPGPGAAEMLWEVADKRVDVLERYSAGELRPQIVLGCYYAEPDNAESGRKGNKSCDSGNDYRVKLNLVDEARSYYFDVMDMIIASEGRCSDELEELDMAVLRAAYAARNDYGTENQGRGILRAVHERHVKCLAPLPVQMNALLQMADWDLLFAGGRKENDAAFQAYEALHDQLEQYGLERQVIDAIFAPSVPVVLPAFSPGPLGSTETPGSSGYIDIAFEITKYGEGDAIEILDTSTNISNDARMRLRYLIGRSRFRPRMANGVFEDPSRVVVRYYVSD
jgi:hypothetical protein